MIRLKLLGSAQITRSDGTSARSVLAQPKRVALLSYLALSTPGEFLSRDSVTAIFWPDKAEEKARNSLRQALHFLRKSLGADVIEGRGDQEIRFGTSGVWCDVRSFFEAGRAERWAEAVGLYTGELLEGCTAVVGADFEHWLDNQRARLRLAFHQAAWKRAAELEGEGLDGEAVALARRAVEGSPFDERGVRALMELLVRVGHRAEAMHTYQRFVEVLEQELDVEPDPETVALADRVRTARGRPGGGAPDGSSADLPAGTPADSVVAGPPRRSFDGRLRMAAAAAALVPLVLTLNGLARGRSPTPAPVVAVHPFENRTGVDSLESIGPIAADAITMGVNARLGAVDAFRSDDAVEIHRSDALLVEGSYRLEGDSVVLSANVRRPDGTPVRNVGPLKGLAEDPREALDELADRVSVVSADVFGPDLPMLSMGPLPKWDAWQAYATGSAYSHRHEWSTALRHYQRALEIDPDFIAVYPRLSVTLANLGDLRAADSVYHLAEGQLHEFDARLRLDVRWLDAALRNDRVDRLRIEQAKAALTGEDASWQIAYELYGLGRPRETIETLARMDEDRMRSLGVHSYWWLAALAWHELGGYEAELEVAGRGLEAFPGHPDLLARRAAALAALGRPDKVIAVVEYAFRLPKGWAGCCAAKVAMVAAEELAFHGHPDEARRVWVSAAEWNAGRATDPGERQWQARLLMGAGRWLEAREFYRTLHANQPEAQEPIAALGIIAARLGNKAEALTMIELLDPRRYVGLNKPRAILCRARIHAALGEKQRALQLLNDATAAGLGHGQRSHAPEFSELWDEPAFRKWLAPRG